jgi:adenosylcobinamide kinase/adenosylcobinamide-phosphate guanylyltransferase
MITLITGGIKSGKSSFALKFSNHYIRKLFIATLEDIDSESNEKINRHKEERDATWETIEEPVEIVKILKSNIANYDLMLIDCINIWINNLIYYNTNMFEHIDNLIDFLSIYQNKTEIILVTNEVGQSIVSIDKITRNFINCLGITNQKLATIANNVYLLVAGIPIKIKG